ncbi:hypothetical protein DIPPA_26852 [Diplonema papillatum]|nr:hypothetical protein DIPPA_26852 [Diplonema papillatum]
MPLVPLAVRKQQPAAGSTPADRLAAKQSRKWNDLSRVPAAYLISGPSHVNACCGRYVLSEDAVNDAPAWILQSARDGGAKDVQAQTVLFSDDTGWSFASSPAAVATGQSMLTSEDRHDDELLPHDMRSWLWGDGKGWRPCDGVSIAADDPTTAAAAGFFRLHRPSLTAPGPQSSRRRRGTATAAALLQSPHCSEATSPGGGYLTRFDGFCTDYPARYDPDSSLTRKELQWLKRTYDEEASKIALYTDVMSLKSTLQKHGIARGIDFDELLDALEQAKRLVSSVHAEATPSRRSGNYLTLAEFIMLCDVLKAREAKRGGGPQNDDDFLDAFIAMGGTDDKSGTVTLDYLQRTAGLFQLSFDAGVLPAAASDHLGFQEFKLLLQKSRNTALDVFAAAGGASEDPKSTVPVFQLSDALNMHMELGYLSFSPAELAVNRSRLGDARQLSLKDFIAKMWKPLKLPDEHLDPNDAEQEDATDGVDFAEGSEEDGQDPSTAAVSIAALLVKKRRGSMGLQSGALVKRFEQLCRRLNIESCSRRPENGPEGGCVLETMRHILFLNSDILRRFVTVFSPRVARDCVTNSRFKRAAVRVVGNIPTFLDEHDRSCLVCQEPSRLRKHPVKESGRKLAPTHPDDAASCSWAVSPAEAKVLPQRTPRSGGWKIEALGPDAIVEGRPRIHTRTASGQIEADDRSPPQPGTVYVDCRGVPARERPGPAGWGGPRRQPASPAPDLAASRSCFLNRVGNTAGVVPRKRVKRRAERANDARYRCCAPVPIDGEPVQQRLPAIRPVPPEDGAVEIVVRRGDPNRAIGLTFEGGLVLKSVARGSPASKAGLARLVGCSVTSAAHVAVSDVRQLEAVVDGLRTVALTFAKPRCPAAARRQLKQHQLDTRSPPAAGDLSLNSLPGPLLLRLMKDCACREPATLPVILVGLVLTSLVVHWGMFDRHQRSKQQQKPTSGARIGLQDELDEEQRENERTEAGIALRNKDKVTRKRDRLKAVALHKLDEDVGAGIISRNKLDKAKRKSDRLDADVALRNKLDEEQQETERIDTEIASRNKVGKAKHIKKKKKSDHRDAGVALRDDLDEAKRETNGLDRDEEQRNSNRLEGEDTEASVDKADKGKEQAFTVHVAVFTYNRIVGLKRLWKSLEQVDYLGHTVPLTIFLDKKDAHDDDKDETEEWVRSLRWTHGPFAIHKREVNVGLKSSILEAWYPTALDTDTKYVAFFEDDTEVSPFWYVWGVNAISAYGGVDAKLFGISLYRPVHDELTGKSMMLDTHGDPFIFQQPCSWGAIYSARPWQKFRDWTLLQTKDPVLKGDASRVSSNTWSAKSSWKKYLLKYMWNYGYFMVYPNLPDRMVLSTNHLMKGMHNTPKRSLFELPLLQTSDYDAAKSSGIELLRAPEMSRLQVYDLLVRSVASYKDVPGYDKPT